MTVYTIQTSPLGKLLLVGEKRSRATTPAGAAGDATVVLDSLSLPGQKGAAVVQDDWVYDPAAFTDITSQLGAYFAGTLTRFTVETTGRGTEFQRRVWRALETIPYGTTISYGKLAAEIGVPPAASRAVGASIGANPLLVVRPCHRVVGVDGRLTGYAAGLDRKQWLLSLEGAVL